MYLGIDIGTSAVKLSLVSGDLVQEGQAQAELSVSRPRHYWSEQPPESWWTALVQAMSELSARHDLNGLKAIGLSGQMHGAVLQDEAGEVIRPAILWNDGRSYAECDVLASALPSIGTVAGVPPMPGFTAPKLLWLSRHEPRSHARIAHILLPKDFIGWKLHGEWITDRSDAAGTLWLEQQTRSWSDDLCKASTTDPAWLPHLHDGTDVVGRVTQVAAGALGVPAGIPVAAGGGDAATGAVGVGAVRDGACFLSLGTSGQLFAATASYRPNPEQMVHAFCHTVPDMWFQMAAMLNGARPMRWFADIVGAPLTTLLADAQSVAACDAPLFLPYLTGERTPHADAHIRGAFYGLKDGMGRKEMMRGVINAIAFSFADAADSLRGAGTEPEGILAIGGGAQSDLLLQSISDVLRSPVRRVDDPSTGPAFGAAKLAAVAVGAVEARELDKRPAISATFNPGADVGMQEGLHAYRTLYRRLKDIHIDLEEATAP